MSSNMGSMASAWASTLPLPPTIPARPMLPQGAAKHGRGGRPPNASTWGGHRRRGRGVVASTLSEETPNGAVDTTETSLHTSVRSNTATASPEGKTVPSVDLPPNHLPSRPPRPAPKRAKASVPKVDVISNTDPAPPEITPVRPPHRRRGKASPHVSSTKNPPKSTTPAPATPDTPVSLISIPESQALSSASECNPEADPSSSNTDNLPTSPILDAPTTTQDMVSLVLPSLTDNAHRPNTPSTHSHIDWADDDDSADLPDLDDWGFASKPPRRRSSASKPSIVSTATPIPPISVDLVTSPGEDVPSPLSAPSPGNNPNADVGEPSIRKPKGRSPLDPGRSAEKNKSRSERGRERRKKKEDTSVLDGRLNPSGTTSVAPSSPRGSKGSKGSSLEVPSGPPPASPASGAHEVTKPEATNESGTSSGAASLGKNMENGEKGEHVRSGVPLPSEAPQSASDTPYHHKPVPAILSVPIQTPATATPASPSFNPPSIPSRPSSSGREPFRQGGVRSSHNSLVSGAPSSRHSPSPPKLPINGGHVHAHSHSTTRPIISPNALHQLTKSLSGGTRQHRPAVSAQ